jgi:hypothetical protein
LPRWEPPPTCHVRLFDHLGTDPTELEIIRVVESTAVTHLKYRPVR